MGAKASYLKQKITPAVCHKTQTICGNLKDLESFLNPVKKQKNIYIHSYSPHEMKHRQFGKPSTVINAYKNGHNNLSVWQYANWLRIVRTKQGEIVKVRKVGKYEGFVLDVDNHPCSSIPKMISFLKTNKTPLPALIVQTSFNSFHLVYLAPRGYWTIFRKKRLALWFCGETKALPSAGNLLSFGEKNILTQGFVDVNYLQQMLNNDTYCKFRVPGSTHSAAKKKISGKSFYEYQDFTCIGWTNNKYDKESPLFFSNAHTQPECPTPAEQNNYWKQYENKIYQSIRIYMPDKSAKKWSSYISQNLTRIKKKKFVMSQDKVAEELKISQMTVSRHLKILRDRNILEIEKEYMYVPGKKGAGRSRVYRAGSVLSNIIGKNKTKTFASKKDEYSIVEGYEKGDTWLHFLSDVRYLYKKGCSESEVVFFIEQKMKYKHKKNARSRQEIQRAYRQWHKKNVNNELDGFVKRPNRSEINVYKESINMRRGKQC